MINPEVKTNFLLDLFGKILRFVFQKVKIEPTDRFVDVFVNREFVNFGDQKMRDLAFSLQKNDATSTGMITCFPADVFVSEDLVSDI